MAHLSTFCYRLFVSLPSLLPAPVLQFLCHLQVSLLEPSAKAADATSPKHSSTTGPKAEASTAGHHTEHAMTASGASKLRGLLKGHQEQDTAPPLTSRYIRVVNTFDVSRIDRSRLCLYMFVCLSALRASLQRVCVCFG
jgi:hypothetical protein